MFFSSANASQLNFITIDDSARSEIQQALVNGLEVTTHQSPITVNGWQGSGYSIINPEYGVGAYKISGGASGGFLALGYLLTVLGYLLTVLGLLADLVDSASATFGHVIPMLATVGRFISVASFIHGILKAGGTCNGGGLGGLIFAMTMLAIIGMALANVVATLANPLIGFAGGLVVNKAINWFTDQAGNCK